MGLGRNRDRLRGAGDRPVRILQSVPRDCAHNGLTLVEQTLALLLQEPCDTGRRGRLDEHTFFGCKQAVGREDLAVGDGVDQTARLIARL